MTETITLDGRRFTGSVGRLAPGQVNYVLAHLRLAGVIEVLTEAPRGELGAHEKRADDFLTQILARGQKAPILAGCLTEEGKVWTRAEADRNAARFDAITDPAEISQMTARIAEFVVTFFSPQRSSFGHSGISFSRFLTN